MMIDAESPTLLFLNGLGDQIINLPAIRAISAVFGRKLTLAVRIGAREAFFSDVPARNSCPIQPRWQDTLLRPEIIDRMKPCDLFICLNPWIDETIEGLISALQPRHSIGFFPAFGTHVALDYSKHSSDLAFDIPRAVSSALDFDNFAAPPTLPKSAWSSAQQVLNMLPRGSQAMTIHIDTADQKVWPPELWALAIEHVLQINPGIFVFVVGKRPTLLTYKFSADRVFFCYGLPLLTSMALVARSDLFAGVDSCMLHVADAFRVPGVGVFGPTNPHEFGFRFAWHRHVSSGGHISEVQLDEVIFALEELVLGSVR